MSLGMIQSRRNLQTLRLATGVLWPLETHIFHNPGEKSQAEELIEDEEVKDSFHKLSRSGFRTNFVWEWDNETQDSYW